MKKMTAVFTVLVLLVGLLTFGVHAEGFVFREVSRAQGDTSIQVVWNYGEAADGDEIEDILIGGVSREFTMDEEKTIIVDTSTLDAGVYTVVYEYVSGAEQGTVTAKNLTISGTAEVTLSAVINDDGTVTVTAKNASGIAVPGYSLLLTIGNMSGITGQTDANGKYTSFITLDYGQSVTYEGVATIAGQITYAAAAQQSMVRPRPTTTTKATTVPTTTGTEATTDTTTDTTVDTTVGTTVSTVPDAGTTGTSADLQTIVTVVGAGTTAVKNDKVLLNVSTDTGVLNLFGCEAGDFAGNARLHISQTDYISLVGRNSSNMLMLNMLTSANQVSETQIRTALEGASAFADYSENERTWVTFDLSFLILDKGGNVIPVSAMPIDSTYVVELPVPASMKNCKELAVTMMDGDGLMPPVKVAVSDGRFKLEINALESYTLIGFAREDGGNAGGVSSLVVWLFVIGILLIAGAGVLLFLFVFRKPAPAAAATVAEEDAAPPIIVSQPEDDGNDIYSGRTDMPPSDGD